MGQRDQREKAKAKRVSALDWAKDQDKGYAATSVQLPEGVEFYKLTPGTHVVDFMEYLAGPGNPRADAGFPHWVREFTAHGIVGHNGRSNRYVCRAETFGKPCPPCDWYRQNGKTADEKLARDLRGKKRHLYLLNSNPGSPPGTKTNPYKVLDQGYYNRGMGFGEMLVDAVTAAANSDPGAAYFFAPDSGYSVQLTVKEMTGGDFKYNGVTRIDLVPRKRNYDEGLAEKAPCLDAMLVDLGEKALHALVYGSTDDTEDAAPARKAVNDAEDADGGAEVGPFAVGDYVEYDGKECEVVRVSPDGTSLTLEDAEGAKIKGVGPDECEPVPVKGGDDDDSPEDPEDEDEDDAEEEEAADEADAPRGRVKPARGKPDADEDDDPEDEDDADEEALTADERDDEDEDEDVGDGDEEEEGPPPPKKKPVPKPAPKPAPGRGKPGKKYGS